MTPKQAVAKLIKAQDIMNRASENKVLAAQARDNGGTYSTYDVRVEKAVGEAQDLFAEVEAWILEQGQ